VDEQQAFIAAICAAPKDDIPRLVYADWLDENGQPEQAEFIRVQCELAKWHTGWPAMTFERKDVLCLRERDLWKIVGAQVVAKVRSGLRDPMFWQVQLNALSIAHDADKGVVIRRGFVDEFRGPAAWFYEAGPRLVAEHPITRVVLTDKKPRVFSGVACEWLLNDGSEPHELPSDFLPGHHRQFFGGKVFAYDWLSKRAIEWAKVALLTSPR
jgi:uncharacterized protein (TIGR02996 family)